jgi:hypothetical protein
MSTLKKRPVESDEENAKKKSSIATATRQGSKRQGLLRKAAIGNTHERITITPPTMAANMSSDMSTHIPKYQKDSSSENEWLSHSTNTLPLPNDIPLHHQEQHDQEFINSPTTTSQEEPYVSTTDDEDIVSLHLPSASNSTSSFDPLVTRSAMPIKRRRSHHAELHASTATTSSLIDLDTEDEWDYSETEWWGWVILAATWIVFVVVMGSCLGIWSWAWDVGETPYAPPDLEDDETLPITGYYPALMVCTAVMSWVWVVVAWVGLKYFRHAKVVADDG